jgi:hypothetical protein
MGKCSGNFNWNIYADEINFMYEESWTYHPLLNISVIPQRSYNLAPSVASMLVRQANRHKF